MSLKIGVHHGPAIAVTLHDELDYFGQTVNIASRVQDIADAKEIWIAEDVLLYPGASALLESGGTAHAELRGIDHPMTVLRISNRSHPGAT